MSEKWPVWLGCVIEDDEDKKSPGTRPGLSCLSSSQDLGCAALLVAIFVFIFILALAALLLVGLSALLSALTGLALLTLLAGLSCLAALLSVLLHIVCHESIPPLNARLGALVLSSLPFLSCPRVHWGWDKSKLEQRLIE
jgi:hypothetical protein